MLIVFIRLINELSYPQKENEQHTYLVLVMIDKVSKQSVTYVLTGEHVKIFFRNFYGFSNLSSSGEK